MKNLVLGVVLAIVAITLIIILFFVMPRQKSIMSSEIQTAQIKIAQLETENYYLKQMLQECERGKVVSSTVLSSSETYSSEAPAGATGTGSSGTSLISPIENMKPVISKTNKKSMQQTSSAPKVVIETRLLSTLPQKVNTKSATIQSTQQATQSVTRVLPSYYYASANEDSVTYCLMFGNNEGRHVPALDPKAFDPVIIKPNHLPGGGTNFYTYPTPGFIGDLGVTDKGVFFFSKELINAFIVASDNGIVQLKAPATGWAPMDLVYNGDGYYTWSPN